MSLQNHDIWNLIDRDIMVAMCKRRDILNLANHLCVSPAEIDEKYREEFGMDYDTFRASLPSKRLTEEEQKLRSFIKRLPTASLHAKPREEIVKHDILLMYQGGATTRDVAASYGLKHHSFRKAVMDLYGETTEELQEQARTLYNHEVGVNRHKSGATINRVTSITLNKTIRRKTRGLR